MINLTKKQQELSLEMIRFPLKFSNACYFGSPSDELIKVNNGTMTLVRFKGEKYGITNFHVIDAYRQRLSKEPDIVFYIGNTQIDLEETLVDEDKDLDLSILYLEGYDEEQFGSGGEIPTHFYDIDDFTLGSLSEGDFIMFGGYPGVWRTRPETNHLVFDSLSSGGTEVTEVTDMNIRCEIAIDKCNISLSEHHSELPENLGGLSGGPVFSIEVLPSGLAVFNLIGIIYEHIVNYDSIMIRPITFINDQMLLVR